MDIIYGLECKLIDPPTGLGSMLSSLLQDLDQQGFINNNIQLFKNEKANFHLKSSTQLLQVCSDWSKGMYRISELPDRQQYNLTINITSISLALYLALRGEQLESRRGSLISALTTVMRHLICDHGQSVMFGNGSALSARNFRYPHVRPPRNWQVCDKSGLVELVDARFESQRGNAEAVEKLRRLVLPEGARREEFGDILLIQWASDEDMTNNYIIKMRLSTREQCLAESLNAPIAEGWNIYGEHKSDPIAAQPHPVLTLYSPPLSIGYKAVHTATGAEAVQDELRRVAEWIRQGTLDNGTVVSDVILIVESREAALAIRPLAQAEGIPHLVYVGEDGHMWDPFPEGEWL